LVSQQAFAVKCSLSRYASEALEDCTFVMATTARPRGNMPLVTARVAAEMLAKEAKRGKVAILFGNERTGLTNDELAQAHAAVAIPTAGQGALCRKSLKYTGGTGPTSLNLSQAVGVLAYELFMAADALDAEESDVRGASTGKIDLPASQLMTVGEKEMLKQELLGARRALDVLPGEATLEDDDDADVGGSDGSDSDSGGGEGGDATEGKAAAAEADDDLDVREERGIERVLNSAPLARRDAAALFQLARRVKAIAGGRSSGGGSEGERVGGKSTVSSAERGLLDEVVVAAAAELVEAAAAAGKPPPTVKQARTHFRKGLGLSLTGRAVQAGDFSLPIARESAWFQPLSL
jgi:tRNA(Leu) C34 or U34 (ribose-2'-O)-methylase TrmL